MNQFDITANAILELAERKRVELKGLSKHVLEDLLHDAEELRSNETFSIRTAAEIIRYAAESNLTNLKSPALKEG